MERLVGTVEVAQVGWSVRSSPHRCARGGVEGDALRTAESLNNHRRTNSGGTVYPFGWLILRRWDRRKRRRNKTGRYHLIGLWMSRMPIRKKIVPKILQKTNRVAAFGEKKVISSNIQPVWRC
ncbi:hypothetical protein KCP71_22870 [Salmonella enterica subsp. enterica]|nr:hypothetical protein KCP71_22870 [Salmonella enterica subsp. enterica]